MLLPPAQRVQAVGGFTCAERCGGHGVEFQPEADESFQFEHHVEIEGLLGKGVENVWLEDGVVELHVIPTDDEVRFDKFFAKFLHFVFGVNFVGSAGGAVSDAHGDAHF